MVVELVKVGSNSLSTCHRVKRLVWLVSSVCLWLWEPKIQTGDAGHRASHEPRDGINSHVTVQRDKFLPDSHKQPSSQTYSLWQKLVFFFFFISSHTLTSENDKQWMYHFLSQHIMRQAVKCYIHCFQGRWSVAVYREKPEIGQMLSRGNKLCDR